METKYTSLIERYFDKVLPPEEIAKVERLKKTDSEFILEFELFEKSHQALKLSTIIDLKSKVRDIHQNMTPYERSTKVIALRWIGIAASIMLIVASGFYIQRFSNENLYEEAYLPVGDYVTNMDNDLSELEKAMDFFNRQQLDSASQLFNKIYSTTEDQVALFYLGQCHYQSNRLDQAIETLKKVSNNYQTEAHWYVALAYLKMENEIKTLETLNFIINQNQDETFVMKATKLKNKLQSIFRKFVF